MKKIYISLILLLAAAVSANAQYNPRGHKKTSGPNLVNSHIRAGRITTWYQGGRSLQSLVDAASPRGGVIRIKTRPGESRSTYAISLIDMKSGVHIQVENGVTLRPTGATLFTTRQSSCVDTSIVGIGGRFTVDFSRRESGAESGVFIRYTGAFKNFLVKDVRIKDRKTIVSAISMTGTNPENGTVENVTLTDGHRGYGLVQVQGGRNLTFKNLNGTGGVCLRLESGITGSPGKMENITGTNIANASALNALMLEPHNKNHGRVIVHGVKGTGCFFAAVVNPGFVNDKDRAFARDRGLPAPTPGSFANNSLITRVRATANRQASDIRFFFQKFIGKEAARRLSIDPGYPGNGGFVRGPSIAPTLRHNQRRWRIELTKFRISQEDLNKFFIKKRIASFSDQL